MKQEIEAGQKPNWAEIENHAKDIGALTGGELLEDLVSSEMGAVRTLGGEFITAVANLSFGP